ncbi:MAG: flagellar protein FlaG [Magnetococcales bacterium]|nr:flagellar protein FlaG [Magnetococcales bacterium]
MGEYSGAVMVRSPRETTEIGDRVGNRERGAEVSGSSFEQILERAEQSVVRRCGGSGAKLMESIAGEVTQSLNGLRSLGLTVEKRLDRVVVRVMDRETNDVIRRIPGEQKVDLVQQMRDLQGLMVKARA